jgi:pseudouridine kinase
MSGVRGDGHEPLPRIADWFHERGVARVFITLGERGVYFSDGTERQVEAAGQAADVVTSASGAGDAFVAGLAYAWLNEWTLSRSVRFAMSAAEVALAHASAINPAMSTEAVNRRFEGRYAG